MSAIAVEQQSAIRRLVYGSMTELTPIIGVARLCSVTFVSLTFTRQKNGVRGERVGHSRSGDPHLCPVASILSRISHLRQHHAPPDTTLNAYLHLGSWAYVLPSAITSLFRLAAAPGPPSGGRHPPALLSARSTRSGGAMALLGGGVDSDRIRLIGRWRSDEMYRYLHIQSQPTMSGIAAAMLRGASRPFSLPTLLTPPLLRREGPHPCSPLAP